MKCYLINWSTFFLDKGRGDLGIRVLSLPNDALSGKWLWKYGWTWMDWEDVFF